MKLIKWLWILLSTVSIFSICLWTSSPDINLYFPSGNSSNWSHHLWNITPWETHTFSILLENKSNAGTYVQVWFVDWTITKDSYKNKACLAEWQGEAFWNYVNWDSILYIPEHSNIIKSYSIELPDYYQYTWNILWCITLSTMEPWFEAWSFNIISRKANFIDMDVYFKDTEAPEIIDFSPEDNTTNFPTNATIEITFSEPMKKNSVKNAIQLNWTFVLDWNENYTHVTISSPTWFDKWKDYTFVLWTWATDTAGNSLESKLTIHFRTEEPKEDQPTWSSSTHTALNNKLEKDNCPNGDYSNNSYDWNCWFYREAEEQHNAAWEHSCSTDWSSYSSELNWAYTYACWIWITTMPEIKRADMMWPLLRKHLAKMISEFSLKVMWAKPDYSKECIFDDMKNESKEMQYYAELSCKLWLMWLHADWITVKDSFDPNEYVTRAQFWTVLSRMLWWTTYAPKPDQEYYTNHLEALHKNEIMTEIYGNWPNSTELRWWVMLMLQRINENILISDFTWTPLIDQGHIHVTINNSDSENYYTNKDNIHFIWEIDQSQYVWKIVVSHNDSTWKWVYNEYTLQKYNPWDSQFSFYAYRWYNSLTVNDLNSYKFDFYNNDWEIISTKTIHIHHNYNY